ncbi:uncharacterized protein LOC110444975 [Mizuhopecten yessoensis]|uniref:uncharacterized protein LOC110444975 n=1 Tax=Mizuhopecten yessoensis TaxID=6573 RepID=UPI000B45E9AD|nr:uncharacterized protein LOC110444975 [Mizuhopecten yessoensis]
MSLRLRLIITTWALVSGCYGQSDVINRRCCVPSHFRCTMDVTGGYTDPVSGTTSYVDRKVRLYNDYDLNATRTDTDVTLPSGVTFVHSELTFYDKHISYKIDGGKCRTDHITDAMQDKCIPGIKVSLHFFYRTTYDRITQFNFGDIRITSSFQ